MTFTAGPWDGTPWAEAEWRSFHAGSIPDHMVTVGSITPSSATRDITLSGMVAWIQGSLAVQSGTDVLTLPVPSGSNKRDDFIVLEYDPGNNTVTPKLVGTEGVNPSSPSLTQDDGGIWQMPIYRIGPYGGSGAASTLPREDYRVYSSKVRGTLSVQAGFRQGGMRGDLLVVADDEQIYRHDGSTYRKMLNTRPGQSFSSADGGFPKALSSASTSTKITNQLTVPSADYDRELLIVASHHLYDVPTTGIWQSYLFLSSSQHSRAVPHTGGDQSSATLSATYSLKAQRSLQIRVGFRRTDGSGEATSSGSTTLNNINVLATPA